MTARAMTQSQVRIVFLVSVAVVAAGAAWALPRLRRRYEEHTAIRRARAETWAATVRWMNDQRAKAERDRRRHDDLARLRSEQRNACHRLGVFNQDVDAGLRRLLDEEGQP